MNSVIAHPLIGLLLLGSGFAHAVEISSPEADAVNEITLSIVASDSAASGKTAQPLDLKGNGATLKITSAVESEAAHKQRSASEGRTVEPSRYNEHRCKWFLGGD